MYIYTLNGHRNTRHSKCHSHYVGSELQWDLGQCESTKLDSSQNGILGIAALPIVK